MKKWERIGILLLIITGTIGAGAIVYRFNIGMKVTNLTSNMAWGMWVAFYIYCIGLSAGSFLLSSLVYVFGLKQFEKMGRIALLSALFALFGGLAFVWIDLGHPWRFLKIFTNFQLSSVMAWESLFYIFYMTTICAELWFLMRFDLDRLARRTSGIRGKVYRVLTLGWKSPEDPKQIEACQRQGMRRVKFFAIIGIPIALVVHGGTGALFAVVAAKPYWFSGLFPIIFLVSAVISGCGLMLFLYSFWGRRDEDYLPMILGLRNLMVMFIAIDALLFISDLLVGLYGQIPLHVMVLKLIIFGDYWYVFWIGQIGVAWVLPVVIASLPAMREKPLWLGLAGGSTVLGIVAVRMNLVIPAYLQPQLPGLDEAYQQPRLAYEYFPSALEWISSHGLVALLILGFIVFWKLLPLFGLELTNPETTKNA